MRFSGKGGGLNRVHNNNSDDEGSVTQVAQLAQMARPKMQSAHLLTTVNSDTC